MDLQKQLQDLMKKHGLTTSPLAERSGISQPVIHRILTGEMVDVRLSTACKLATAFGLKLSQLVGEEPIPS